jgi:type VI secretion system ImpC/EvpB family protein
VALRLGRDIARIDALLSAQLDAVLHHPALQKLEASWRGLRYLVDQVPDGANVKVRVLSATWKELARDQDRALEFDQSQLFRKVYSDEFGTPGGEPFGLLVGDYDVTHRPFPDHPTDDIAALRGIASVSAAAFAPFICGVDPRFLELDSFAQLQQPMDVAKTFEQLDYLKWRAFRDSDDARFVGLTLPRVLLRAPHGDGPGHAHRFNYREDAAAGDRSGHLWGSSAFALAGVVVRAFAETAWLAEIRGVRRGEGRAGVVDGLPALGSGTGAGETPRSITDVHLTDAAEKEIADLGFIPLCHQPGAGTAAFYSVPSAQKPKAFDEAAATANAKLSAMLPYILCVSRFAHYLKVILRDKVGQFTGAQDYEDELRRWLQKYVVSNESASHEMKAKYPLREASCRLTEVPGKPGTYNCTVFLRPHFQLDHLSAGIKLTTQLTARGAT